MDVTGVRLSLYFGEALHSGPHLAADVVMDLFARHAAKVAVLFRGLEGFGASRRIHAAGFPDISSDLPLVATAVDTPERIESVLGELEPLVDRGLLTLERLRLLTGDDVARAARPARADAGMRLTIYCGRGERAGTTYAYRAIVDLLRRQGAGGATVLLGVDGFHRGARERARLFARNVNVPMAIIVIGREDVLARALSLLHTVLAHPVVTLERVTRVKHDGVPLEPFPVAGSADGNTGGNAGGNAGGGPEDLWQSVEIYSRRNAHVDGRSLHGELTRQLRRLGAAGITTITGEWGFTQEGTYGDKLWTRTSHAPTCTRYIDRREKVLELWPVIDELTAEYGLVISHALPAYRERVNGKAHHVVAIAPDDSGVSPAAQIRLGDGQRATPPPSEEEDRYADDAGRWVRALTREARQFARRHGRTAIALRMTLIDGEQFFLGAAEPGPGAGFVTLHPHPERRSELVAGAGERLLPPRQLVVPLASITKVEFLPAAPRGTRSLATFHTDDEPSW